jgi:glutamate racemase
MMQNDPKISGITVGFFDSGLGGAEVKRIFESYYPELQTLLFMDREHAPY